MRDQRQNIQQQKHKNDNGDSTDNRKDHLLPSPMVFTQNQVHTKDWQHYEALPQSYDES